MMNLLLKNVCWHYDENTINGDVRIVNGSITEIGKDLPQKDSELIDDFNGSFLYPGLINAHDHLEMNLYPTLGNPPYGNYIEWAKDIYHPKRSPLREIEKVSIEARLLWGGLKNLIAGAVAVVHHNPWNRLLGKKKFPVNVPRVGWAHSLAFEKNLSKKMPRDGRPFVIHAAEGVDSLAFSELTELNRLSILNKNTVLVHAIAVSDQQLVMLANSQPSIVWCPASNLYMFGRTASIEKLNRNLKISLGSDSTLTGSPTLLHEMKVAEQTRLATAREIYAMATGTPAQVFNLPRPAIVVGSPANLFVAGCKNIDYFQNLIDTYPADISLVIKNGVPGLIDASTHSAWTRLKHEVSIQGTRMLCDVDVRALKKEIARKVPLHILDGNPLWNLLDA
jgi:cytosine/adenosine deaminase-related metal-dependent hydrolase